MSRSTRPHANAEDDELVSRFIDGDEDALRAVLCRFGPHLRAGLARKYRGMLNSDEIADIVLMGTFRAWRARGRFNPGRGSLLQWLRAIARNEARCCLRETWRQGRFNEQVLPADWLDISVPSRSGQPDPVTAADGSADELEALRVGLARLSRHERAVLMEAAGHGRSARDIAEILGVTPSTVRTLRSRALRKLKSFTKRPGGDP